MKHLIKFNEELNLKRSIRKFMYGQKAIDDDDIAEGILSKMNDTITIRLTQNGQRLGHRDRIEYEFVIDGFVIKISHYIRLIKNVYIYELEVDNVRIFADESIIKKIWSKCKSIEEHEDEGAYRRKEALNNFRKK